MKTVTVKLDYATMRFLKQMMNEIKDLNSNINRGRSRR